MVAVGVYVAMTAPFLPLLLYVNRYGGAYTGLFVAALVLQLVPIGLVFFPLGFIGVGILGWTLWSTRQRLLEFRRSGIPNPSVHAAWVREYLANLVAMGFALEQKGAALAFLEASTGQGLFVLWAIFLPASVLLWAGLAVPLRAERRRLLAIVEESSRDD
jgi:hypothetical protein